MERFDLINSPLEGTGLVEASAGTGKTHTISCLYLRLIVESGLTPEHILVVTFTEAATGELKARIRDLVVEAREAFAGRLSVEQVEDKPFLKSLLDREPDRLRATRRLTLALDTFDQASIHTIHGFCRRLLHHNAFESNTTFDTQLISEQDDLAARVVHDFWRRHFYRISPLFFSFVRRGTDPGLERFFSIADAVRNHHFLDLQPAYSQPIECEELENRVMEAWNAAREAWFARTDEIAEMIAGLASLNGSVYRAKTVPQWPDRINGYLMHPVPMFPLPDELAKVATPILAKNAKKGATPPVDEFFDICGRVSTHLQSLSEVFDRNLLAMKREFVDEFRGELPRLKQIRNMRFFDDLLTGVHDALTGPRAHQLKSAVGARYHAALIDEFQDTDPLQYEIFRLLFAGRGLLLLIGDPKQSIYGFRGADIHAYLGAKEDAERTSGLVENWRSEPGLVRAVNTIFSRSPVPFVNDSIAYHNVEPALNPRRQDLRAKGLDKTPMHLWFMRREGSRSIPGSSSRGPVARAVASEIVHLLNSAAQGRLTLGERPLAPSDIAVLVRKKDQALPIQAELSVRGVPSVLRTNSSVFDTPQALQMQRVLQAVSEPGNPRFVHGAMATEIVGVCGNELDRIQNNDHEYEQWFGTFYELHNTWNSQGFMRMFGKLLRTFGVRPRLLRYHDGERKLTDILHIAELLHREEANREGGNLLGRLNDHIHGSAIRGEEQELRLEKDDDAVQFLTIHRSKGLEFPVVFAPYLWGSTKVPAEDIVFHDPRNSYRAALDLGSPESAQNRSKAMEEGLGEDVRLMYVALTRAKNRCYLIWGHFYEAARSALSHVLHYRAPEGTPDSKWFKGLSDEDMLNDLHGLAADSDGAIKVSELPGGTDDIFAPQEDEAGELAARTFSGTIDRSWRTTSFTGLTATKHADEGPVDRDPVPRDIPEASPETEQLPEGIFAFPRGAAAGNFFHSLLEQIDFTDIPGTTTLIDPLLARYGFDAQWGETAVATCRAVADAKLTDALRLRDIAPSSRLNELEFFYPLQHLSVEQLSKAFSEAGAASAGIADYPEKIGRLHFAPTKGYVRGFMDLVFEHQGRYYLVDWKSNHLGNTVSDYDLKSLSAAMMREHYVLQYYLYLIGLDCYLRTRIPDYDYEKHFGGVYYFFLRGLGGENACGVYGDRPSGECVRLLSKRLCGGDVVTSPPTPSPSGEGE